ncbi:MAG: ABC transporter ATP-binding protein [Eubacteriales bacterium]|nr:ABC transporter ATP-binding protein [Eubacteriales bacterium]
MKNENRSQKERRRALTGEFYRENRGAFALIVGCMICLSVVNVALAALIKELFDAAAGTQLQPVIRLTWAGAGVFVMLVIPDLIRTVVEPRFYSRALSRYKEHAFRRITEKGVGTFQKENTSRYLSALTNDMNSIEQNYLEPVFQLVMQIFTFFGALALMLYYSPLLTAIALLLSVLPLISAVLTGGALTKAEQEMSDRNEHFVGTVRDLLEGFTVVKSFRAEQEAQELFVSQNAALERARAKRRKTATFIGVLAGDLGAFVQIAVFAIGAFMAVTGMGVTAGVVMSFVQMMNYVLGPVQSIPPIIANRKAARALIDKLAESLSDNTARTGKDVPPRLEKAIAVQGVSFGYEEDRPILRDVDCVFEAGKSYAVVGASGSGKSTLLNLLLGFREDYAGRILLDEHELREISPESLFDIVSIVQQNVFVFNDTIRNNITMFHEFPEDEVRRAIERSGLSALVRQKGEGYLCGENGKALSGGERQRISIARCLLRNTPVMLIDEATAALDAATAFGVTKEILALEGLTRIVVTHRLEEALLRAYDGIVVLRGGRIVQCGRFDELMEDKGYFYSLFTVSQAY